MALTFSLGYKPLPPDPGFVLPDEWVSKYLKSTENPVSPIIEFKHTTRRALAWVDMEDSTQAQIEKSPPLLLLNQEQDEDGEPITTFAGREWYWNNQIRKVAIEQGLDKHVPQVLYLVRPETAYISCLHFLARELGGIEKFKDQREFIIHNSGLQTLMVRFWARVQETHWSGGFSPGIGEQERLLLILALIECFQQSPRVQGITPPFPAPCPYVPLELLHGAGIYLPSVQYGTWLPTSSATDQLKEMQKRANFPGLPSHLGSYVECYACNTNSLNPDEMTRTKHQCTPSDKLKCNSCGLGFENHADFKVHCLTFCKQGPLSQSKCACCNTPGPECLCTSHWKRTYNLVNTIMAKGLVPQVAGVAETLIDANIYLGIDLVETPVVAGTSPPTPVQLKSAIWEKSLRFPQWVHKNGHGWLVVPGWDNPCPLGNLQEMLDQRMGKQRISWPFGEKQGRTPSKEPPKGTPMSDLMDKHIGPGGITVESSKAEDIETLEDKITRTSEKLIDPKKAKILSKAMKLTIPDLWQEIQNLKDLQNDIAIHLSMQEDKHKKNRREKLKFRSPSPGGSQHSQDSPKLSPHRSRKPFVFGAFEIPHPRNQSKSPGRRTSSRSPGARTGTSVRGSSKTHTLAMDLQKATSVLNSARVDPKGTSYRRKYGDLKSAINKADQHLRYDPENNVDSAYAEDLEDLIEVAEELLDRVDEKSDEITANQEESRRKEAQIAKCLPRSQPQKWDGSVNDFIRFKNSAKVLMDNIPNPRLALNAIIESISDNRLRRRLSRYATPEEALTSLELEYGNPELSGPKIINDMKALTRATGVESESSLILKIKELHVALNEIKQEHLLGRNELYNLCHKFREHQGEELLGRLYTEEPDNLREVFFDQLEKLYTKNTIWSRTDLERSKKPRETFEDHSSIRKIGTESQNLECTFCGGNHFNHQCNDIDEVDLNQIQELQLCPHCLGNKHDEGCPHIKKATFLCKECKLHYKLKKLHVNCKRQDISNPGPPQEESRVLDEQAQE